MKIKLKNIATKTDIGIIGILSLFFLINPELKPNIQVLPENATGKSEPVEIKTYYPVKNQGHVAWLILNGRIKNYSLKRGYIDSVIVKLSNLNIDEYEITIKQLNKRKVSFLEGQDFSFHCIIYIKKPLIDSTQQISFSYLDNYGQPVYYSDTNLIAYASIKLKLEGI
jgi:hypothetical protein